VASVDTSRNAEREAALDRLRQVLSSKARDPRPRWLRLYQKALTTPAAKRLVSTVNSHMKAVVGHIMERTEQQTRMPSDITELRSWTNPQVTRTGQVHIAQPMERDDIEDDDGAEG